MLNETLDFDIISVFLLFKAMFPEALMQLKKRNTTRAQQKNQFCAMPCGHKPQKISKDATLAHKVEMETRCFTWEG